MKKVTILFMFAFVFSSLFAQNTSSITSKKGEIYLPEAGDWAISIDASPFLKYAGNFIGSNGLNTAPTFDFLSGNRSIIGKYFITDKTAYRVGARIGLTSYSTTDIVQKFPSTTPVSYVDDVAKTSASNIALTLGKEWRKGKTRLQGFYGAEAGISLGSSNNSYTYGNALSNSYPVDRIKEYQSGLHLGLGVRGFIGAEYFILPKMSIGGEFGWGLALNTTGKGKTTNEYWNGSAVKTEEFEQGGNTRLGVDAENLNSIFGSAGTIRLTMHF